MIAVDPRHTSRTCAACGHADIAHANAARNIQPRQGFSGCLDGQRSRCGSSKPGKQFSVRSRSCAEAICCGVIFMASASCPAAGSERSHSRSCSSCQSTGPGTSTADRDDDTIQSSSTSGAGDLPEHAAPPGRAKFGARLDADDAVLQQAARRDRAHPHLCARAASGPTPMACRCAAAPVPPAGRCRTWRRCA